MSRSSFRSMRRSASVGETMALLSLVKTRLFLLLALAVPAVSNAADEPPSAQEILAGVRLNQVSQRVTLKGQLRNGPKNLPFRMVLQGPKVQYEFSNPPETVVLTLGEKDIKMSDVTEGGSSRVTGRKFADAVRATD